MRCARVAAPLARAPTRAPASTLHQLRLVAAVKQLRQMPLRSCYQKSRCAGSRRLVRGRHCCSKEHLRQPNPPPAPSSLRGRKLLARGASSIMARKPRGSQSSRGRARWPRVLPAITPPPRAGAHKAHGGRRHDRQRTHRRGAQHADRPLTRTRLQQTTRPTGLCGLRRSGVAQESPKLGWLPA